MRKHSPLVTQYIPVTSKNWDNSRLPIKKIIIHTMEGTLDGSTAWFSNPASKGLAHYGIGLNGRLVQWATEDVTAYHAGNYKTNQESIGIEHEDGYNPLTNPGAVNKPRPDALYESSSNLCADICHEYDIVPGSDTILRHRDVADNPKPCPGSLDVERIIRMTKEKMGLAPSQPKPPVSPTPKTVSLPESDFLRIVIKSRNWDEVVRAVSSELSKPYNPDDPKAYEPVIDYINHLRNSIVDLSLEVKKTQIVPGITDKPENTGNPGKPEESPPILFQELDVVIDKLIGFFKKKTTGK